MCTILSFPVRRIVNYVRNRFAKSRGGLFSFITREISRPSFISNEIFNPRNTECRTVYSFSGEKRLGEQKRQSSSLCRGSRAAEAQSRELGHDLSGAGPRALVIPRIAHPRAFSTKEDVRQNNGSSLMPGSHLTPTCIGSNLSRIINSPASIDQSPRRRDPRELDGHNVRVIALYLLLAPTVLPADRSIAAFVQRIMLHKEETFGRAFSVHTACPQTAEHLSS